ncbi:L-type lectin-domain containing receptor kinase IV.4 [Capsicum annuum]|uniref:L-type lectin-domain containing receptor kinase IV.1 isoform X1 n=1 Tax=Capsicum annuum TaxID=4072 RepID=UPI0007BFAF7C|nr:L-type lectin-domain containing receptor kinase IV.1 isoform X1 [Capsicum annuum]KAF3621392.1 L-type lectin-domain containing receptor kinase IV.4 [Capsicum annuum]
MLFNLVMLVSLFLVDFAPACCEVDEFIYNGFQPRNIVLDGIANLTSNGLLLLTDSKTQDQGHAFYPNAIHFKNSPNGTTVFSFSTTFVFAIRSDYRPLDGHGLAFVIAPQRGIRRALANHYLGLFNSANNGDSSNHIVGVELDTIYSADFDDMNDNHVGIDINGLKSLANHTTGYFDDDDTSLFHDMTLVSGQPMQVWVDYDGSSKHINVTVAPLLMGKKPVRPLLSLKCDLSPIFYQTMYVGFSSSTGSVPTNHYILGWSFKIDGKAQELSQLPKLPRLEGKRTSRFVTIGLPVMSLVSVIVATSVVVYYVRRKKYEQLVEDWEREYRPQRFNYKDLYKATKGFREKEVLGAGGFGKVYKGVMPITKLEIAVKKISHESRQGMKEFVSEIVSIGRMQHRNVVPLLGYCRRKGELLLVYEYMSNGSLDKYLYDQPRFTLDWTQRFRVIRGIAAGLFFLHEECDHVVVHRDIKASNVLLDGELNGRLGDFGLARLYGHGTDPQSTRVVGTLGYLAPEHTRTGRATPSSDVFSFGAFLLEVACGKRPIQPRQDGDDLILVDWVFSCWSRGNILEAVDPNLGTDFVPGQVELVLSLGLFCSHSEPSLRPTMRQNLLFLDGVVALPELSALGISSAGLTFNHPGGFDDFIKSYPCSSINAHSRSSSVAESFLSDGR